MFSGIVEETGTLKEIRRAGELTKFVISADQAIAGVKPGDSIANNGCCLTVTEINGKELVFDLLGETLRATNLGAMKPGSLLNIERSLCVGDRIGGHFVTGHVDCTALITKWEKSGADYELELEVPKGLERYLVPKGCVAIDGISLTVNEVDKNRFGVNIIPQTWSHTTLGGVGVGGKVNLEVDLIARYLERLIEQRG